MSRPVCQAAIDLIQSFEKCRLEAYLPTPNDYWTIGWGETGPDIVRGLVWTQEQADASFAKRLQAFAEEIDPAITIRISDNQFGACVSLSYNIGADAFENSTLCHKINNADFAGAADEFPRWNKQARQVLAGLTRRRQAERSLFLTPDP